MPIPWLRLVTGLLTATDVVRRLREPAPPAAAETQGLAARPLEAQVSGLMIGALREVFDRDRERLDIERERLDRERERAERALRLELLRQAGERELGRLRLLGLVALGGLLATLVVAARLDAAGAIARGACGLAGVLCIAGVAAAFSAQGDIGRALGRGDDRASAAEITTSPAASATPWLVASGLAAVVIAALS